MHHRVRVGDQVQVGQRREIAVLCLDLGVKEAALGHPSELFPHPDEVPDAYLDEHVDMLIEGLRKAGLEMQSEV